MPLLSLLLGFACEHMHVTVPSARGIFPGKSDNLFPPSGKFSQRRPFSDINFPVSQPSFPVKRFPLSPCEDSHVSHTGCSSIPALPNSSTVLFRLPLKEPAFAFSVHYNHPHFPKFVSLACHIPRVCLPAFSQLP